MRVKGIWSKGKETDKGNKHRKKKTLARPTYHESSSVWGFSILMFFCVKENLRVTTFIQMTFIFAWVWKILAPLLLQFIVKSPPPKSNPWKVGKCECKLAVLVFIWVFFNTGQFFLGSIYWDNLLSNFFSIFTSRSSQKKIVYWHVIKSRVYFRIQGVCQEHEKVCFSFANMNQLRGSWW